MIRGLFFARAVQSKTLTQFSINGSATTNVRKYREEVRMDKIQSSSQDEAAIQDLVERWAAAVRRKDFEGILQDHSPEIVMFDVPPPFQSKGIEAYKQTWELFFSCSSGPIVFDIDSMTITAASEVAFVVATMHCTEPGADGERQRLDFRLTIGLRKIEDRWTVVHEHHSLPAEG
jgi:uncharacterized protein (TIGR02246 family)